MEVSLPRYVDVEREILTVKKYKQLTLGEVKFFLRIEENSDERCNEKSHLAHFAHLSSPPAWSRRCLKSALPLSGKLIGRLPKRMQDVRAQASPNWPSRPKNRDA